MKIIQNTNVIEKEEEPPPSKKQIKFLLKDNMKGEYLSTCLNKNSWTSPPYFTKVYDMGIRELVSFVQNWMQQNEGNFDKLWYEKQIGKIYQRLKLPHLNNKTCPKNKNHKEKIKDVNGKIRCAHKSNINLRPSFIEDYNFFDKSAHTKKRYFYERAPNGKINHSLDSSLYMFDIEKYNLDPEKQHREELKLFEQEKKSVPLTDICYTILSDKDTILPLETILKRLNIRSETEKVYCNESGLGICERLHELNKEDRKIYEMMRICPGHLQLHNKIEFNFDAWALAFYIRKWYKQLSDKELSHEKFLNDTNPEYL